MTNPSRKPIQTISADEVPATPPEETKDAINSISPEDAVSPPPAEKKIDVPLTDEDWEKKIEQAKIEKEQRIETPALPQEPVVTEPPQEPVAPPEQEKQDIPVVTTKPQLSEEEIARRKKIVEINNASKQIFTDIGDDADFEAAFTHEIEHDDRSESEKTKDPTEYATALALASQLGQRNKQSALLTKWINELAAASKSLTECVRELRLAKITPELGDGRGPKKLSGDAARLAVISRQRGLYRVQLYNSGFWITLRTPTLIDCNSFVQEVDNDFTEIGRTLGGHYHTVMSVFLKQKLCDIAHTMLTGSNFDEWRDKEAFMANLSFQDYDTILWALCCMMYKDGIGIGCYCTNPECKYIDTEQYINLTNACYINTDIFNSKAVSWMLAGVNKTRTAADLKQYREEILGFKKEIDVDDGLNTYLISVPVMTKYLENGTKLVSDLITLTNGEKNIHTETVMNQLTFNLYRMLTPWIHGFVMKNENKETVYYTEDTAAIYESLDVTHYEKSTLYDDIEHFMRDTKISFYSLTTIECPKCGKRLDLTKDNMLPLDMEYVFFCLSCLQLAQTGAIY